MTDLLTPAGGQLHNAKGNVLKKNQLVRDEIFGEGITRGVVQLDRGVGYNVLVDWRQPAKPEDRPKPKSRGPENLTVVGGEQAETEGAREQTILRHTGAEFESGAVHRARGLNESHPGVVPEPAGIEVAEGWRGGHANYAHESGRRRKLASTPDSKTILVPGRGAVKVFKGSSAVEDESWIYITEIKENSSKVYMCLACRSAACPHFRTPPRARCSA